VHQPNLQRREQGTQTSRLRLGAGDVLPVVLGLVDVGDDHEGPMAGGGLAANVVPEPVQIGGMAEDRPDRQPPGGNGAQVGDVQVRVDDLADRPWDRGRRHEQDVGGAA
jgi:hypothetical protein